MNPIPEPFPCVSPCARAARISRPRCDTEHVTPLCGVAAGPAAGSRLPSCPAFPSRRVKEEAKPFSVLQSPSHRAEDVFEDMCPYFEAQGQVIYTTMCHLWIQDIWAVA